MSQSRARLFAVVLATPVAFVGLGQGSAYGKPLSCEGRAATKVVTARSPHVVFGTARREVIVVTDAGHVIKAGAGN